MEHVERGRGRSNSGTRVDLLLTRVPREVGGPRVFTKVLIAQLLQGVDIVETMASPRSVGRLCCERGSASDRGCFGAKPSLGLTQRRGGRLIPCQP